MNIFYCCGVLEPQKKIWWKKFLNKEGGVAISKKFHSAVTHVVCGRESTTLSDILKATNGANLTNIKIVHTSWLLACMKTKQKVSEVDFMLPSTPAEDVSRVGSMVPVSSSSSSCKLKRVREDTTEEVDSLETADVHRLKQQKNDTPSPLVLPPPCDPLALCTLKEPTLCPPPSGLCIGSLTVAAYGVGTLAWGVTYPDPSARPTREDVATLLEAAASVCVPHRILIDTADSYCTDRYVSCVMACWYCLDCCV